MVGCRIFLLSALLRFLVGGAASAADRPAQGRVGGMEIAEGGVAIRLPESGRAGGESRPGECPGPRRNDPVAAGMSVRTEAAARAVLRVGGALLAFSGGSEADIIKLDDSGTTIALRRGRLGIRLSGPDSGSPDSGSDVEITIPSGALRLSAPGEY